MKKFFPTNVCLLMWSIKWKSKHIKKKKTFFVTKFLFRECLCVGNVSITHRGHLFYFRFMESYWLLTNFKVILHVPIWVLLILGTQPFSGSNLYLIRPRWQIWFLFYKQHPWCQAFPRSHKHLKGQELVHLKKVCIILL